MSRRTAFPQLASRSTATRSDDNPYVVSIGLAAAIFFSAMIGFHLDRSRFGQSFAGGSSALAPEGLARLDDGHRFVAPDSTEPAPRVLGRAPAWLVATPEFESLRGEGVIEYSLAASRRPEFEFKQISLKTNSISSDGMFAVRLKPSRLGTYEFRVRQDGLRIVFSTKGVASVVLFNHEAAISTAEYTFTTTKNGLSIAINGDQIHEVSGVSFAKSEVSFLSNCCSTEVGDFRVNGSLNGREFSEGL